MQRHKEFLFKIVRGVYADRTIRACISLEARYLHFHLPVGCHGLHPTLSVAFLRWCGTSKCQCNVTHPLPDDVMRSYRDTFRHAKYFSNTVSPCIFFFWQHLHRLSGALQPEPERESLKHNEFRLESKCKVVRPWKTEDAYYSSNRDSTCQVLHSFKTTTTTHRQFFCARGKRRDFSYGASRVP